MSGNRRRHRIIGISLLIVVAVSAWILWRNTAGSADKTPALSSESASQPPRRPSREPLARETVNPPAGDASLFTMIGKYRDEFSRSADAVRSRDILEALRQTLREAPDEQAAAAAVSAFLHSGADVSTRLPFAVGQEGMLETAPTLRTALLDMLVALDPSLALEVARSIMDHTRSPDEYAIALRNLAWNDLDGDLRPELAARFKQLIERDEWRKSPTAGFLEAFDAAVQLNSPTQFSALLQMAVEGAEQANSSLTRASMVALDRMTLRNPELLTRHFAADPTLSGIEPKLRASLLSRLDLADSAQRDVFATYLTATPHGDGEMEYFGQLFPNGNYLHGHWMITTPESTPSIAERSADDREVIAQLDQLVAEKPEIQTHQAFVSIKRRLLEMTSK
jgi:hypothetical protein